MIIRKTVLFLLLALALPFAPASLAATYEGIAEPYTSPYGEWRGQTQYQAFIGGVSDPAAHAVTNLTIRVDAQGKVTGASTENNCRMLGLARPGLAPHIVSLEVTLTGCHYPGLNRTYRGMLAVSAKDRYASLSLQGFEVLAKKSGTFNITATMRR